MADPFALAEIRLWGRTVGAVVEDDSGRIVFEYERDFQRTGLEISPSRLPLSTSGPVAFDELHRKKGFQGLPGLLADALPDAFGHQVIRAYYTARGEEHRAFSPVQHLLYVGERAIGALTFHPAARVEASSAEEDALDIGRLVVDARAILGGGAAKVMIPEIYRIGSSAGGMRPKAIVKYDPATGEVRSAFAPHRDSDVGGRIIDAILKFDGISGDAPPGEVGKPSHFNRVEAAYASMARAAGLRVVDIEILESPQGHAHLVIPRFDLAPEGRLHQHTFGGLIHVDYNDPGASSYEEYLRLILALGMPQASVIEGFRRMVFNVVAVNQDDHVKNLSFHMDPGGTWTLTPAYDVTFAAGSDFTARHQMRVCGKQQGIARADLLAVAHDFSIRSARQIIEQVEDAVGDWATYAAETRVPEPAVEHIGAALRARRAELSG